jgi:adenine specific DNA methylase Mod
LNPARNQLYFGDNLQVLRESIADESVDLIYLDPPFNSKRDYNLLFKTPKAPKTSKAARSREPKKRKPSTATRKRRSPPSRTPGTGGSRPKTSSVKS